MSRRRDKPRFSARPGIVETVAPGIRRLLCPNSGPFTYTGTCTYLLGDNPITVIDPGPMNAEHLEALKTFLKGRKLEAILVSHTHKDHSPLAKALQEACGGDILAFGRHKHAQPDRLTEIDGFKGAGDEDFCPDICLEDGQMLDLGGWSVRAVHTPGHAANHLCFALENSPWLFSGDHVMGWSTTIVFPPDGAMKHYLASLEKLGKLEQQSYLPGHGDVIKDAGAYVRSMVSHRLHRERMVVEALSTGCETIIELLDKLYAGLPANLRGGAGLTLLAHLDWLMEKGSVIADRPLSRDARYKLAV